MTTLKEISRKSYAAKDGNAGFSEIQTGCMQRIADAIELVAVDRQKLQRELAWYKSRNQKLVDEVDSLTRSRNSYKGKLKSAINKLREFNKT